jgi:hypothetical protein
VADDPFEGLMLKLVVECFIWKCKSLGASTVRRPCVSCVSDDTKATNGDDDVKRVHLDALGTKTCVLSLTFV